VEHGVVMLLLYWAPCLGGLVDQGERKKGDAPQSRTDHAIGMARISHMMCRYQRYNSNIQVSIFFCFCKRMFLHSTLRHMTQPNNKLPMIEDDQ